MRTKYGGKKIEVDDIKFDSKMEAAYYMHLKELQQQGIVKSFKVHPRYILLEKFTKNGKTYQPITYTADFYVVYWDGKVQVIDVKGFPNDRFPLKKKLFEHKFPHFELTVVKFVKKFGGWITDEEYNRLKRADKKSKRKTS